MTKAAWIALVNNQRLRAIRMLKNSDSRYQGWTDVEELVVH